LPVEGLSLTDLRRKIREAYTDAELLQPGRDVINVTLIKPRTRQVLVIREDSIQRWPILKAPGATLVVKRGNAAAIDLPVYQNDVLHALIQSGGLPGSDAANELWVLHGGQSEHWHAVAAALDGSQDPAKVLSQGGMANARVSRVKLKVLPGEVPEYAPEDVVLDSGDVVYIPSRDAEMFYTGGLLFGQQLTLPRDYELDVIGAIAIAGGSATGPPGWNGASSLFTGNGGPGSIFPPTRVLVLRKTPDRGQVAIHVDLKKAIRDGRERLPIQPGDVVLLQYTPGEAAGNFVLNMFRFNAGISRNFVSNVGAGPASAVVNPPGP
jgi:protein involved in polysaccharide export with SLBB domain